ncbi:TonB-dependent receptor [Salinibacter grassmerensis]|uniref:TonB-dependent receptor n=1 Tax=Salinibacter grassmerensis TaxID=3040353 RepID=UPI0021E7BADE|nr:TonB-dependent receptor [Salinibacter grassmerensis]
MSTRILVVLSLLTCLLIPTAEAQSTRSTVTGTVTDADGAPLPGAQIADVAFQRGTTAGPDGQYTLDGLPPGDHTLEIRFVGYQTAIREVTLQAGATREINVSLKERVLETDGVTVTGTARARSTLTTPQSVSVLGAEDLDTEGSASLGGVLSGNVAGVSSIQTGSQAGKPVLRGLSGNRIRLLKDGIAQEYYQFGVRHFPSTSTNEAERIEVVRGPSSIQYGSDALGGAINVLTKDAPTADVDATRLGGTFRSQYFTNNNERAVGLDLQGARGPVGVRVGFERRVAGNYTAPDEDTFFDTSNGGTFGDPKYTDEVPFTNFEQWNGYAQVGTQGDFGTVQVYGDYWINRHNFLLPTGGPGAENANGLGQNLEHGNLVAKANLVADGFVVRPRLSVQTSIRQSGNDNGTQTLDFIDDNGGFGDFDYPLDLKTDIYTGRLEVAHPKVGPVSGTLGAEVQLQDANTRGSAELQPTADTWNVGLFVFEEIDLAPWTFNAGVRGDVRTIDAEPNQNTDDPDALENDYLTLSGAVGANVKVADGVAVATNLSSGFRAPSIFELYANGVHGGVAAFQRGTPSLDPERAYSADVSVRVRRDRLTAELTGYVNAINDYIYLENTGDNRGPQGNGPPIYEANQTDAVIPGIEAKVEAQLRPWLHVGGQATVLGGSGDGLGPNGADGDLPLLPANNVQGFVHVTPDGPGLLRSPRIEVDLKRGFDKDAAGRFEPFSQFDDLEGGPNPPFGTASTKAYTTVDASAESRFALGLGVTPILRVEVRNAFDTTYRDFLDTYKGYALSPGRDVRVSLSVPF